MYRFIDVNEIQDEFFTSPDSFTINGVLPESKILGYHTLNVSGREMLTSEVGEKDISHTDGTIYLYKRDLPRELVVTYQLIAPNPEEFMRRFNALCAILNDEQMQIIFNDEQDKYFTATKSSVELPEPGRLAVTGTYTLYCTDPYKYSVKEKNINFMGKTQILNNGTKSCFPRFVMYPRFYEWYDLSIKINKKEIFKAHTYEWISEDSEIILDSNNVIFTVRGKPRWDLVSLNSEMVVFPVGQIEIEVTGTAPIDTSVFFRERWL